MDSKLSADVAARATAIYEQRLRTRLEATNLDDFVAIEPDSGDFFLGKTLSEAIQAARVAHPTRLPFALRVGHKSDVESERWPRERRAKDATPKTENEELTA